MRCIAAGTLAGLRAFCLLGLVALVNPAAAQAQGVQPRTVLLGEAQPVIDAETLGLSWIDPGGTATIEQVTQGASGARFTQGYSNSPVCSLHPRDSGVRRNTTPASARRCRCSIRKRTTSDLSSSVSRWNAAVPPTRR